jgi:hypothetical protein
MNPPIAFAVLWFPLAIAAVWVFTPPVLIALALREWWKSPEKGPRAKMIPVSMALALLGDWVFFLVLSALGFIGGFGTHYMTTRSADWFLCFSLLLFGAAFVGKIARGKLAVASFLVFALWAGSELAA